MAINNSANIPSLVNTAIVGNSTSNGFTTIPYSAFPAGGSNLVKRDANGNTAVNSLAIGTTSTGSGGTTTLTIASTQAQIFTGSSPSTVILPDATTLSNGWTYLIHNQSTGLLTVNKNGGGLLTTVVAGAFLEVYLTDDTTAAGTWDTSFQMPSNAQYGTAGLNVTGFVQSSTTLISGYATTATAAGTTTLTISSRQQQYFTGSTTQTVVLPVASTLVLGQSFTIVNNSTGVVTVQSSGGNTIQAMNANTQLIVTCILTSGTTAASWSALYVINSPLTLPLSLANGGTNASLTASNGGIFYSTASAGAILSGTATAGQLLLSGATAAPTWSTTTYPSTNAINTLLYASSANVMAALATANNGVLITSNSGVPSWLANSGTAGFGLLANSGAPPSWGSVVSTIAGDSGTATGSTITLNANSNAGASVTFVGLGSTVSLKVSDSHSNTFVGSNAGNTSVTNTEIAGFGTFALTNITGGSNTACGFGAMNNATSATFCTAIGNRALNGGALTGSYNTGLGYNAGGNYTTNEASNISINAAGTVGESNTLRIGSGTGTGNQQLNKAFIQGIAGVTVSNPTIVTQDSTTGQLGTIPYATGSFTPALNFGGASVGIVYTVQSGSYTRMANVVYFTLTLTISNKGSSTGNAFITGFPVNAASSGQVIFFQSDGVSPVATYFNLFMGTNGASSSMQLYSATTATGSAFSPLSNTNFVNATTIRATGLYFV